MHKGKMLSLFVFLHFDCCFYVLKHISYSPISKQFSFYFATAPFMISIDEKSHRSLEMTEWIATSLLTHEHAS
jgi:hypothetical protein